MKNIKLHFNVNLMPYIGIVFIGAVFFDIYKLLFTKPQLAIACGLLMASASFSDWLRNKNRVPFEGSLIFSSIVSMIMAVFVQNYGICYLFICLSNVAFAHQTKAIKWTFAALVATIAGLLLWWSDLPTQIFQLWEKQSQGVAYSALDVNALSSNFFSLVMSGLIIAVQISILRFAVLHWRSKTRLEKLNATLEEDSQNKERQRIAHELHDSLGHTLTGLLLYLDYAAIIIDSDQEQAKGLLTKSREITQQALEDCRSSVRDLKAHLDEPFDYIAVISELVGHYHAQKLINVHLTVDEAIRDQSPRLQYLLFELSRESITNTLRHGKATHIKIAAQYDDSRQGVALQVSDDGVGTLLLVKGTGLKAMEAKVLSASGTIEFTTGYGKGFSLSVSLPAMAPNTMDHATIENRRELA